MVATEKIFCRPLLFQAGIAWLARDFREISQIRASQDIDATDLARWQPAGRDELVDAWLAQIEHIHRGADSDEIVGRW